MATTTKRQNFNVTPEQEAEIVWLREALDAPTIKDAVLRAVRVLTSLAREVRRGGELYIRNSQGQMTRMLIPELEASGGERWNYLVARPHAWRCELWVKGRRLRASEVWSDMLANGETTVRAAANWGLPVEAVEEIVRYCESHRSLLAMEAEEEVRRLQEAGVQGEPVAAA